MNTIPQGWRSRRPDSLVLVDRRHLEWVGALNARDLGGLPTADGRRTRYGVLFRSDSTCGLTGRGRRDLLDHGVRTVVDLRRKDELEEDRNPFAAMDGVEYRHRPFNDTAVEERIREIASPADRYRLMIDVGGERIARIFEVLASAPRAVLFHCLSGRDRTGMVAALALSLAGVAGEQVETDYLLSDARLERRYETWRSTFDAAQQ